MRQTLLSAAERAAELAPEPALVTAVRLVELVAVATVALVLARRWHTRRTAPTGWALALFTVFAAVLAAGFRPVVADGSLLVQLYIKVLITAIVVIPYLLVLFSFSLGAMGRTAFGLAGTVTAAVVLATLLLPQLSEPGGTRPGWEVAYITLVVAAWCALSVLSAVTLWRAGRAQPAAIRSRMRSLSLGAVVVASALVVSASDDQAGTATIVVSSVLALLGIILLATAFLMPAPLRVLWRQADLAKMALAERGLMTALNSADVARTILPALAGAFGGGGAALLDRDARTVADLGIGEAALAALAPRLAGPDELVDDDTLVAPMTSGWLVVQAGRFAPLFGRDELLLLDRAATLVDLAMQRVQLFEAEQRSRHEAEALNNELQTLLYSVSHDLRSPIISVLGYLDYLSSDHRAELSAEGQHFLDRITVNALYMQRLITDLLELSRIGRISEPITPVDLGALAESVAEGVRFAHPQVTVDVADNLPTVRMSDVRARQLLTNLVENAVKHAGRLDVHVRVSAQVEPDGSVRLNVGDNGPGIPESYRAKAFDVFERLDAVRRGTPGTGMGLPICRRVVESLGGTIRIDGPDDGAATGTTMSFSLPASIVTAGATRPADRTLVKESA